MMHLQIERNLTLNTIKPTSVDMVPILQKYKILFLGHYI